MALIELGRWLQIRVLTWGFGSEIWVLTWGVHSESGFDSESSGVALIGALAPFKGIDFVLTRGGWREVGEYIEEGMTWERILREMSEWRAEKESGERNGEK